VTLPPLRARLDDLEILVEHFLSQHKPRGHLTDVAPHVWELFRSHRWPGNVRELKNAVQRLLVMPDRPLPMVSPNQTAEMDSSSSDPLLPLREARREASDSFERDYLRAALTQTQNNVTRAAAVAEVSRQMIQKLMRKHGFSV
jgi:transcriptional regulator with PAS, ATPase and Fis domain